MSNFLSVSAFMSFLLLGNFVYANTCIDFFFKKVATPQRGMGVQDHNTLLAKRIEFQEKARLKNPEIRIVDIVELDQIKKEKIVIGFVGFSGGKQFNATAARIAITNFLRQLEPTKVILSTGATNMGVPALIYEIGHRMGFKTLGVTSLQSGKYDPARMDYLLVEGNEWGRESNFFIETSDIIVGFGGGAQSRVELLQARRSGIPTVLVANNEIQGATAQVPGKKYAKGELAGNRVRDMIENNFEFFKWLRKLPDNIHYIAQEDLPAIFPGKKIIGFTGWSEHGPHQNRDVLVEKFVRNFLSRFNPAEHIVATGGTHLGAEKIVHKVAAEMGFKQIALVSHEISEPQNLLNPYAYSITPISRTWKGRSFSFVNTVDALVSFGGGDMVSNQIALALQRGIPFVQMMGNFASSDQMILQDQIKFKSGERAADRILSQLPQ